MTIYQIIDNLKRIALTQPNVRTATDGDVFDAMNGNPSIKYGVFHVTQTTHTENEQFDTYGLNLFMIDRLEDDDANRVSAQSTAKQILSNVIATFCETFDAEYETINYQPFTQKFKDNTAGVWATVSFQVLKDYSCAEGFDGVWQPEIVIINNQDVTITKNGIYEPSEGFTGFGKVEVALPIPNVKESDTLHLTAGDNGVYKPESPYNAVGEVFYHVESNQNKTLDITDNGEYAVMPDEGFGGLGAVEVIVDIPIQDKGMTLNYNGDYVIEPDENYVAMKKVNIKVDYKPIPVIPNGIALNNSTFTTFDMAQHDWSKVYDYHQMFYGCTRLERVDNFPSDAEILSCSYMFHSCSSLIEAPMMDTSNVVAGGFDYMFNACSKLTSVPLYDTSKINSMVCAFYSCRSLTSIPYFDTSNVTDMRETFRQCENLASVPLYNTSKVTDMSYTFQRCLSLQDIPYFDTSNVTNMRNTFDNCSAITTIPHLDTSKVTDMQYMLCNCENLATVPHLDTSNVTDMQYMFYGCKNLASIPQFNTSKVTNMSNMFCDCQKLTSVSDLDTSNVTSMMNMFRVCKNLVTVGGLDISKATNMSYLFYDCASLQEVRFTGNPINVTSVSNMAQRLPATGTVYYPAEYAGSYQKIINAFPSTWTAIGE